MSRQETQKMKGVAILLMLFYHLFNHMENVDLCTNFLFVGGEPLVYFLQKAANPVGWFLVLGGYGLYTVWQKGDSRRYVRMARLMLYYWGILAIFLAAGAIIRPDRYLGSLYELVMNFRYPLLIFTVLAVISYICSLGVNTIMKSVENRLFSRRSAGQQPAAT